MTADKRKVSTDALETLGTIIGEGEKRDAIHLAVEPMVAPEWLDPGEHVTATGHGCGVGEGVGIVDPFLTYRVKPGERFWLVIYPRQIHSLRHVWTHPAFPDEPGVTYAPASPQEESMQWIKDYADDLGLHWSRLMDGADEWLRGAPSKWSGGEYWEGEYLCEGGTLEGVSTSAEFWHHYEIVRGLKVPEKARTNFFTCSC